MKVIISPKENYALDMPAEVTFEDFKILVKKMNVVMSFISKDINAEQISPGERRIIIPKNARSRDEIIEILKILFTSSPGPEMDEALKRYEISYLTACTNKWKWVNKYNFIPEEIGLEKFPEKVKGKMNAQS